MLGLVGLATVLVTSCAFLDQGLNVDTDKSKANEEMKMEVVVNLNA